MKKILLILTLCIAVIGVQKVNAQTRWGVMAGVDITTLHFNQNLITVDNSIGATAGLYG